MHAFLALVFALATAVPARALSSAVPARALSSPRDRLGYEREIDSTSYNQVPKHLDYILNQQYIASQKNKAKLITKPIPDDAVIDNVILESNVLTIVQPAKRQVESEISPALVRQRRGYNLENVRVPARYPYLPVPNYNRFRRWG